MATSRHLVLVVLLAAACATVRHPGARRADALALTAPDGTATTVHDRCRGRDATVLVFWSASCPCVRRYQQRIDALLDDYPAERVCVVGVSSNAGEQLTDVLRVADQRGVRIPILRDEGGRVADALSVRSTPTVVVLDAAGEVRYLGWIDNERLPGEPEREAWLDRALHGVLERHDAFAHRSPTYGCVITRSLLGPQSSPCCSIH
jgi:peroxiredoxin